MGSYSYFLILIPLRSCHIYSTRLCSLDLYLSHHVCDQEINCPLELSFGAHLKPFCSPNKLSDLETCCIDGFGYNKLFVGTSKHFRLQQAGLSEVKHTPFLFNFNGKNA